MWINPPIKHALHMNGLRAFEAAARLGGFAQAADELRVTPGAVAAQVKALESACGAALFERHARGVRLTALGESVKLQFVRAFDALESAARDLRQLAKPRRVHVVTSPALAELWLGPRLPRITEMLHPIEVSVTAVDQPPDLKRSPFDLCLFYTEHPERGHRRIATERVLPVCTPALAAQLQAPADLAAVSCIADVVWNDWEVWSAAMMPGQDFTARGPGFSLYSIAVQQALLGTGVLIGRQSLVQQHLDSGALVAPFREAVPLDLTIATWMISGTPISRTITAVADAFVQLA